MGTILIHFHQKTDKKSHVALGGGKEWPVRLRREGKPVVRL